jgi:hypothetical protein
MSNQNSKSTWWDFFIENSLNPREFANNVSFKVGIEVFFKRWIDVFGTHAAAKELIRNFTGSFSAVASATFGLRIGNSNYFYDIGHVVFSAVKLVLKPLTIGVYIFFNPTATLQKGGLEKVSRYSNYWDALARVSGIVSQERQDKNQTDVNWFVYFQQNVKSLWFAKAIIGGVPKVFVGDLTGSIFKHFSWSQGINSVINKLDNTIVKYLSNKEVLFNADDSVWTKFDSCFNKDSNEYIDNATGYLASFFIAVNNVLWKILEDFIPSTIVVPSTRGTQNTIESWVKKYLYHDGSEDIISLNYVNQSFVAEGDEFPLCPLNYDEYQEELLRVNGDNSFYLDLEG